MKTKLLITGVAIVAAAVLAGCNKPDQTPTPTPEAKPNQPTATDATKAVDAAKATAQQTADQAVAAGKAAQDQAQGVIDKAKDLVKDNKFQDALSTLSQLASVKLTPEQQKLVDDLKAQIQTALAKSAATDVLGGKK